MTQDQSKVLIAGAGPTGLMTALVLAKRGIQARIIDQKEQPISTSNALGIQPRTLELWDELGLISEALEEGHRMHGMSITSPRKELAHLRFDGLPTNFPYILILPQAKTEQLLSGHLKKMGIEVERGVQLEELSQNEDKATATCNGKAETYDFVIGCDGAKSTVRQSAEIPFKGVDLPQHFIMADLTVDWELDASEGHVIYSQDGPVVFFPLNDRGFGRLIFDVSSNERLKNEKKPVLDDFKLLLSQRFSKSATLHSPEWISNFWIHSRVADSYRDRRLFLAGDAAHQHSPFGGQGLNTGVQDAYFLSNLLADVIEGTKEEKDLNQYEAIRRPIGERVVKSTAFMTKVATIQSKPLQVIRNGMICLLMGIKPIREKAMMNLSQLAYR